MIIHNQAINWSFLQPFNNRKWSYTIKQSTGRFSNHSTTENDHTQSSNQLVVSPTIQQPKMIIHNQAINWSFLQPFNNRKWSYTIKQSTGRFSNHSTTKKDHTQSSNQLIDSPTIQQPNMIIHNQAINRHFLQPFNNQKWSYTIKQSTATFYNHSTTKNDHAQSSNQLVVSTVNACFSCDQRNRHQKNPDWIFFGPRLKFSFREAFAEFWTEILFYKKNTRALFHGIKKRTLSWDSD